MVADPIDAVSGGPPSMGRSAGQASMEAHSRPARQDHQAFRLPVGWRATDASHPDAGLTRPKRFGSRLSDGRCWVTLKALADHLGLSITTVSRALNGYSDVAPATRDRILAAAKSLGYTPNVSAQRLITGRVHAIGFVLPLPAGRFADPFLFELMIGLGEVLRSRSLDLVVSAGEPGSDELATYQR